MVDIAMTQVMQFHSDAVDDGELQITGLEGDESISKPSTPEAMTKITVAAATAPISWATM